MQRLAVFARSYTIRARKIGEGSGPPNLTGIKALRTPQIYETKIGKHLLQTYRDATTSDYHAITFYGDKLTVRVGVDETRISAILQDLEADGLGGLYEINKPVVVGQVAANALNVMRGEIAKAELNVAKKMIDVVNS